MAQTNVYGVVILAGGSSSRLGEPKQLLKYQNKSLIRHIADAALEAVDSPVIVVTGSNHRIITDELKGLSVHFAHNEEWAEGMSSSIRVGISTLTALNPTVQAVILTVSDQPFVTYTLLLELIRQAELHTGGIIASSYDDTAGTPVLFKSDYFDFLLKLKGAEGAKKLLKKFSDDVFLVPFPLGGVDIDTQEDYQNLLNR